MDYLAWGEEYLLRRIAFAHGCAYCDVKPPPFAEGSEADKLEERAQLLYSMYLDCLHVGNHLMRCGGCDEKKIGFKLGPFWRSTVHTRAWKEPVDLEYRRMLRSLQAAMEGELTARQKGMHPFAIF